VTGRASDADDLAQEAFCRLLQAEVGGLGDEELRRYVFRIGSNLLADRWRRATQELSCWIVSAAPASRTLIRSMTIRCRVNSPH
jgi:DNA-directed RNA polymerase specialized sigma24 family protein